jgi:hypothetical protein
MASRPKLVTAAEKGRWKWKRKGKRDSGMTRAWDPMPENVSEFPASDGREGSKSGSSSSKLKIARYQDVLVTALNHLVLQL